MASEQRLYTISSTTQEKLRKFRLGTSRAADPQAIIYAITKSTLEIAPEDEETYTSLAALAEELPDNAPRFVLLSHPLTLADGRKSVPYVLIAYMPRTCNQESRMLYASARELLRREAGVGRVVECVDAEDVEGVEGVLKGED